MSASRARVGLIGFGYIGSYVYEQVTTRPELGIDIAGVTDEAEMEHLLHHLAPSWAPTKAESPSGIKPVGLDVHGYVSLGTNDVLTFFALQTGEYVSEDVLYPELTGRVVVFAPSDTTTDEG